MTDDRQLFDTDGRRIVGNVTADWPLVPGVIDGWSYYLSGPISGDVEGNLIKFRWATENLREAGYSIVSPVEVCEQAGLDEPWDWYMRRDIEAMLDDKVRGIIMLPGWEDSKGAKVEMNLAVALGFVILSYEIALRRIGQNVPA